MPDLPASPGRRSAAAGDHLHQATSLSSARFFSPFFFSLSLSLSQRSLSLSCLDREPKEAMAGQGAPPPRARAHRGSPGPPQLSICPGSSPSLASRRTHTRECPSLCLPSCQQHLARAAAPPPQRRRPSPRSPAPPRGPSSVGPRRCHHPSRGLATPPSSCCIAAARLCSSLSPPDPASPCVRGLVLAFRSPRLACHRAPSSRSTFFPASSSSNSGRGGRRLCLGRSIPCDRTHVGCAEPRPSCVAPSRPPLLVGHTSAAAAQRHLPLLADQSGPVCTASRCSLAPVRPKPMFRFHCDCEHPFDYVGSFSSWTRSSSERDFSCRYR